MIYETSLSLLTVWFIGPMVMCVHRILTPSLLLGINRCQDSGMIKPLVIHDNAHGQPTGRV